jgi:hypothetical protein
VVAAAVAALSALGLGLVGWGTSPVALTVASGAVWAIARARLPPPVPSAWTGLSGWWEGLGMAARLGVGAVAGLLAYVLVWLVRHPSLGFDAALYHSVEVVAWVRSGHPGSVIHTHYDFPVGSYPLTDEVLQSWGAGIARSWVPIGLWPLALFSLCAVAARATLGRLGVRPAAARLATAAILLFPWLIKDLAEPITDLPAMAWLLATACLCAAAVRRPALLPLGIVAAGLSVGTRPTPAVFLLVMVGAAAWALRGRLRQVVWWCVIALAVTTVIGGFWYIRDWIQHGSPLWPQLALAGGDPSPPIYRLYHATFLERPGVTLHYAGPILRMLGGAFALIVAAVLLPVFTRSRLVLLGAGTVALGALVWTATPGTGVPGTARLWSPEGYVLSETRYLLPTAAVAALTLAIATRESGAARWWAWAGLAVGAVWSLVDDAGLKSPYTPGALRLLIAAALGAVFAGVAIRVVRIRGAPRMDGWRYVSSGSILAVLAAVLGAALGATGDGWVERLARNPGTTVMGQATLDWAVHEPGFEEPRTINFGGWAMIGPLAGDRFQHRLVLIPARAPCDAVRADARRNWTITTDPRFGLTIIGLTPFTATRCLEGMRVELDDGKFRFYKPT